MNGSTSAGAAVKKGVNFTKKTVQFARACAKVFSGTATVMDWKVFLTGAIPALIGCAIMALFGGTIIIAMLFYPIQLAKDFVHNVANFFEKLNNFVTFQGWNSNEEAFYNEVSDQHDNIYNQYSIDIDTNYIVGALNMSVVAGKELEEDPTSSTGISTIDFDGGKDEIKGLMEHMVSKDKCTIDGTEKNVISNERFINYLRYGTLLGDSYTNVDPCNSNLEYTEPNEDIPKIAYLNGFVYKKYLNWIHNQFTDNKILEAINNFNDAQDPLNIIPNMGDITNPVDLGRLDQVAKEAEEIIEMIYSVGDTAGHYNIKLASIFGSYSAACPGVNVTGKHSGTYPLEEYIAGVIKQENGGAPPENLKVQAILARTYLLKNTNNCSTSIENSETSMTFVPVTAGADDVYINAANETAGQVLTLDGNLISTYFASYPKAGYNTGGTAFPSFPACGDVVCDDKQCTTTFYKMPNVESFTLSTNIKHPNGNYWTGAGHLKNNTGHCYGYSQIAGRDLELTQGKNYRDIINIFHSEGVGISTSSMFSSGGWQIRETAPTKNDEMYTGYQNIGQCVWFAKSRAIEILTELKNNGKMDATKADKAIQSLKNTYGHATDWYKNTSNSFNKIGDYNQPQAGSIIVWSGGCNHSYGHVAIIEEINTQNNTITITDSYSSNSDISSCPKSWDCIVFRKKTYTLDDYFNNYIKTGGGTCKTFLGYVNFVNNDF